MRLKPIGSGRRTPNVGFQLGSDLPWGGLEFGPVICTRFGPASGNWDSDTAPEYAPALTPLCSYSFITGRAARAPQIDEYSAIGRIETRVKKYNK